MGPKNGHSVLIPGDEGRAIFRNIVLNFLWRRWTALKILP